MPNQLHGRQIRPFGLMRLCAIALIALMYGSVWMYSPGLWLSIGGAVAAAAISIRLALKTIANRQSVLSPRPQRTPEIIGRVLKVDEEAELPEGVLLYRGQLRGSDTQAYEELRQSLPDDLVPVMRSNLDGRMAIAVLRRAKCVSGLK